MMHYREPIAYICAAILVALIFAGLVDRVFANNPADYDWEACAAGRKSISVGETYDGGPYVSIEYDVGDSQDICWEETTDSLVGLRSGYDWATWGCGLSYYSVRPSREYVCNIANKEIPPDRGYDDSCGAACSLEIYDGSKTSVGSGFLIAGAGVFATLLAGYTGQLAAAGVTLMTSSVSNAFDYLPAGAPVSAPVSSPGPPPPTSTSSTPITCNQWAATQSALSLTEIMLTVGNAHIVDCSSTLPSLVFLFQASLAVMFGVRDLVDNRRGVVVDPCYTLVSSVGVLLEALVNVLMSVGPNCDDLVGGTKTGINLSDEDLYDYTDTAGANRRLAGSDWAQSRGVIARVTAYITCPTEGQLGLTLATCGSGSVGARRLSIIGGRATGTTFSISGRSCPDGMEIRYLANNVDECDVYVKFDEGTYISNVPRRASITHLYDTAEQRREVVFENVARTRNNDARLFTIHTADIRVYEQSANTNA